MKLFNKKSEATKTTTYLWKSMKADLKSAHGDIKWTIGKWYKEKNAKACSQGFHASERAIDAMRYINCEIIAKVEVRGKSDIEDDKQCWSKMKIIEAYTWKKEDSVELAIYCAELVIDIFEKSEPNDKRPREAIEAAKKWLKNPSEKNRNAAYAANAAAYAAAYAANAAYAAAYAASAAAYAAANAAYVAAYAAAYAAYAAAYAANAAAYAANAAAYAANAANAAARKAASEKILDKCASWIEERIKTLEKYGDKTKK